MMSSRFPFLALCLSLGMLASCSLFHREREPEKPAKEEKTTAATQAKTDPLPGGDSMMPVHSGYGYYPYDKHNPMPEPAYVPREGIREPNITQSLPLNLDGTTAKPPGNSDAPDAPSPTSATLSTPAPEALPAIP